MTTSMERSSFVIAEAAVSLVLQESAALFVAVLVASENSLTIARVLEACNSKVVC